MTNDTFFMCLLAVWISSFVKSLSRSSAYFKLGNLSLADLQDSITYFGFESFVR